MINLENAEYLGSFMLDNIPYKHHRKLTVLVMFITQCDGDPFRMITWYGEWSKDTSRPYIWSRNQAQLILSWQQEMVSSVLLLMVL